MCDRRAMRKVHGRVEYGAWRKVVLVSGLRLWLECPGGSVALVFGAFVDGEGGHSNPRQTEVIGTIVVARFGSSVGADGEAEFLGESLHGGIKIGALGPRDFDLFGRAKGRDIIVIEIEREFAGGHGRVFAQILRSEK